MIPKNEILGFAIGVLATVIVLYVLLARAISDGITAAWMKYRNISSATKITFGLAGISLVVGIIVTPARLNPLHLAVFFTILATIMGLQDLDHKIH